MIGAQAGVEVNIMPVVGDAGSLNFNPAEIPPTIPLLSRLAGKNPSSWWRPLKEAADGLRQFPRWTLP